MNAEIIAVGTEILLGDITNTNAQYLAKELAALGINVYCHTVVGDNEQRLHDAYKLAFEKNDIVITSGGLGPTADDLTKEVAAKYFDVKLIEDKTCLERIQHYFDKQGINMTSNNKKQSLILEGSQPLKNDNGTAPGIYLESKGKKLIMLPGPPQELIPMFENEVIPILKRVQQKTFVSKTIKLCGIGESAVECYIEDLMSCKNPTVAPYAKQGEVWLRVTACAENVDEARTLIATVSDEICSRLGGNVFGFDDDTLESVIVSMLKSKNYKLAVSESCTGGMVSARLIGFPSVSDVFVEGLVTYSNESKMKRLGVKKETLDKYGAVSHNTAAEMARGVCEALGASVGLSTTGVAGPSGGTDEKPVGLVYIGICINGEVQTKELKLSGDRYKIRTRATVSLLDWLRRIL